MLLPLVLALAALANPADPQPLTAAESQELQGACKPLADGLAAWAKQQGAPTAAPADILRTKGPELAPKMEPGLRAHCADLFVRALQEYQQKVIETEPKMTLKMLATGLASNFAENGKLCPSADHPVPLNLNTLDKGPYHSTAADWSGPGWKCAGGDAMTGEAQRFQYDLHTNPKAGTFEITAAGRSVTGGRVVQFVLHGEAKGADLKLGDVVRH